MLLQKTEVLKVGRDLSGKGDIEKLSFAADILRRGGLVAFPTETVYGLGANALDERAVESIFRAKGRPQDNPLIVHFSKADDIAEYAHTENNVFFDILKQQMPAPLTVILPKKQNVPSVVTAGLDNVASRVPTSLIARKLIELAGVPVAAPSANLSGKPSPTTAYHVICDMENRADVIIDGGECDVGVESTVVTLCGKVPMLLRPGGFTHERLEELLGKVDISDAVLSALKDGEKAQSPGMKYKHYSPDTKVILVKGNEENVRAFLEKKIISEPCGVICYDEDTDIVENGRVIRMGSRSHSEDYAERLFAALRLSDSIKNIDRVYAVLPFDTSGISLAIYNRMLRAAAFNIADADAENK